MNRQFVTSIIVSLVFTIYCAAELQVNTHTTNDQKDADLARSPAGHFIVVWASYLQDGSSNGIFGQQFDPNCSPIGEEFQINTTSSGNQAEPAVAVSAAGFVVTWHGPGVTDEDREDIFAQRFDPNGLPLGDEVFVNTRTIGRQRYPDTTLNEDGSFVIVWESLDTPAEGDRAISGQMYDSNGVISGPEFMINTEPSVCRYPVVASDANDGFAVAWLDDRSTNSIMCRLFDPNGLPRTEEFQVNTVSFGSVTSPSIAMDSEGYFVVTWDGDPNLAALDDIHAQVFEPNGVPLGEQFLVNTISDGPQTYPQVAMNEKAEFVVVWENQLDPNSTDRDIFAQRFVNFGQSLDSEFQVNTYSEGDQRYPVAALGGDGSFVTAWQSYDQDGSGYGIFAEMNQLIDPVDPNDAALVDPQDYIDH
jgi:hypothetical protein